MKRSLIDYLLVAVVFASLALAGIAFFGPGIFTSFHGVRLSSQTLFRPAIIAIAAGLFWLSRSDSRQRSLAALSAAALQRANTVAVVLAVVAFGIALRISHFEAAGSDPYGYVSQAQLWAAGNLIKHEPVAAIAPWPEPEWTLSPLGYRPGPRPATIVPTYPPGLPLVMAALLKLFGPFGPFLAVPLLGAVAVYAAFLLGRRVAGDACGLLTAVLLLTSPIFLYQLKEPMSDVPVTAFWLLAIVLVSKAQPAFLPAGIAAAAAIMTRPNLAPVAAMLAVFVLAHPAANFSSRFRNILLFSLPVVAACIGIAVLNSKLYGSPTASGYGSMSVLFSTRYFWPNAALYSRWLIESETPFILLAATGFVLIRDRARFSALFAAFAVALYAGYAFYTPFDNWTYLRFLLPAIPLLLLLCSISVLYLSARLPTFFARLILAGCMLVFVAWRWDVTGLKPSQPHERRFAAIGEYARDQLPRNAIVFSMIHSGSVRYYSGRPTLRWDLLPVEWLERSVLFLRARGYHPFLLIEEWERPQFVERFGSHTKLGTLDWPPIKTYDGPTRAEVFDLIQRE